MMTPAGPRTRPGLRTLNVALIVVALLFVKHTLFPPSYSCKCGAAQPVTAPQRQAVAASAGATQPAGDGQPTPTEEAPAEKGSAAKLHAEDGTTIYYHGSYWNDYDSVQAYINKQATGEEATFWMQHLLRWNGNRPFKKALMLSCGNGWVERGLFENGVIEDAVGIDVSDGLLELARKSTTEAQLPFRYYMLDSNTQSDFPEGGFDLVVNHAALHHVAYLDFHLRAVAKLLLPTNGTLVNHDYQGPHRNQYPAQQWQAAVKLNEQLPADLQHPKLRGGYPHLPTMLATDPSEAIHSELIVPVMRRYFQPAWYQRIGGALAYPVVTHNTNMARATDGAKLDATLRRVIAEDKKFTSKHPESSLFFYSIEKPKPGCLDDAKQLGVWTKEEAAREAAAAAKGGVYYPQTEPSLQEYGAFKEIATV